MPSEINLTLEQIQHLIDKYGSPLYVYDEDAIRHNAKNFMSTFIQPAAIFQNLNTVCLL